MTDDPAIEFAGVSRWYGDTVAVADVSFTVGPGVTGLLGHNGAGKSTALKLCAGFTSPSTGPCASSASSRAATPTSTSASASSPTRARRGRS